MNKKIAVLILACFSFIAVANAQRGIKVGYIDMDYILKNIPEYKQAQQQLDSKINNWRKEVEAKKESIKNLKENLENERPLLTSKLIEEREGEVKFEQQKLLDYQQKRFGAQGDMMTQKRQLLQPIQDQIFNAVQEIGQVRQYDFIFENTANALLLFSAPRHDISDQVLSQIKRSFRNLDNMERKADGAAGAKTDDAGQYKSVEKAAADKKAKKVREAEQTAEQEKRQAAREKRARLAEERNRVRDSIRSAKREKVQTKRQQQLKKRQQRRDSIRAGREKQIKQRKKERAEEREAQKKERNNN
jgi:Skp family chaperone for outer membrane proteins